MWRTSAHSNSRGASDSWVITAPQGRTHCQLPLKSAPLHLREPLAVAVQEWRGTAGLEAGYVLGRACKGEPAACRWGAGSRHLCRKRRWSPTEALLVVSKGNNNPFHQDRMTGAEAFKRVGHADACWASCGVRAALTPVDGSYPPRASAASCGTLHIPCCVQEHGYRMLFTIQASGQAARPMVYKKDGPDGPELLSTLAPVVAMDAAAAGFGRGTNVWHGRLGDGLTLTLDMVHRDYQSQSSSLAAVSLNAMVQNVHAKRRRVKAWARIEPGTRCSHRGCKAVRSSTKQRKQQHKGSWRRVNGKVYCPAHQQAANWAFYKPL